MAARNWSGWCSNAHAIKPMPNGRPAPEAIFASAAICSGVVAAPTPIIPKPPAAETAAARRPPATPAIGADTIGAVNPNRSVSSVLVVSVLMCPFYRATEKLNPDPATDDAGQTP